MTAPHTDPTGAIVNCYGRAASEVRQEHKDLKHDHFRGKKGLCNAIALVEGEGPLYIVEGVFDLLALAAAGIDRVVACFGLDQWPWQWARAVPEIVLALDYDEHGAGQQAAREFARAARLRGKRVAILPAAAYGGAKDVAEAWQRLTLDVEAVRDTCLAIEAPERAYEAVDEPIARPSVREPSRAAVAASVPLVQREVLDPEQDDPFAEEERLEAEAAVASRLAETGGEIIADAFVGADDPFVAHAVAAAATRREDFARALWLVCDALAGGSKRSDELERISRGAGVGTEALQLAREALGVQRHDVRGVGSLLQLPAGPCRCAGEEMPERP